MGGEDEDKAGAEEEEKEEEGEKDAARFHIEEGMDEKAEGAFIETAAKDPPTASMIASEQNQTVAEVGEGEDKDDAEEEEEGDDASEQNQDEAEAAEDEDKRGA